MFGPETTTPVACLRKEDGATGVVVWGKRPDD